MRGVNTSSTGSTATIVTKGLRTIFGFALVCAGVGLLYYRPERSEWVGAFMMMMGGFFVSQTVMLNLLKAAIELLPRKPNAGN